MVRMLALWLMLLAFFFLAAYPLLDGSRYMVVSILGWLMLIKSVVGLWFPGYLQWKFKTFFKSATWTVVMGALMIIIAAFLVWVGLMKF